MNFSSGNIINNQANNNEGCGIFGFVADAGNIQTLTELLGHTPRRDEDFARDAVLKWQK
jgi:hypothetical protein